MKLRSLFSFSLILLLLFALCTSALADGNPNIDSGEGEMGEGSGGNIWYSEDGVRITVLRSSNGEKVACFDWTNYNENNVQIHFGKRSKKDYRHGYHLTMIHNNYTYLTPTVPLPKIVSGSGNNITEIKTYFTDTGHLANLAADAGLTYDELISGDYKILLEPMAYFFYNGIKYAMTATEAALFDLNLYVQGFVDKDDRLLGTMGDLTHQNLPLSMFLEESDPALSLRAWEGAATGFQSNGNIIDYLGMGLVTFTDRGGEPDGDGDPGGDEYDFTFRCDTDVIVSFPIYNSGEDITPDDDAYVTLDVGGTTYHRQFVCPAEETQLIWVEWHTPSTPQELTMTATGAGDNVTLRVTVEALEENTPPDPTYHDSGNGFTLEDTPDYGSNLYTEWGEWFTEWVQEHGEHLGGYQDVYDWVEGEPDPETGEPTQNYEVVDQEPWYYTCTGYCAEHGYWEWEYVTYTAWITVRYALEPDDRCQTDYESYAYGTVMGSGYGVQATVTANLARGTGVESYDVTPVQNMVALFPEFDFQTYNRLLENTRANIWQFKSNPYSYYGSRIHFTPLWYPDDTYYTVPIVVFDAWTPGGQLYATVSDAVYIFKSCLDDWVIRIVED